MGVKPKEKLSVDLDKELLSLKMSLSYEEIISRLGLKLKLSNIIMKFTAKFHKGKRKKAITIIKFKGVDIDTFGRSIEKLMIIGNEENKKINLNVFPEHYVLIPHGNILEVIETTGNSPLPTQFFITFDDEDNIDEKRDLNYSHQSVGLAKLDDESILGGVRHQFKETDNGIEARLLVEFPNLCPKSIVRAHQLHLAVEWSGWIESITSKIEK